MAAVPSSLPSEDGVKEHPHQVYRKPGPKGAYEARQVKDGFYVRVDMPGVPPDGVKLVKYGKTRTVTFTGKAPKCWPCYDSSDRVYCGYVVLDKDPNEVDIDMTVLNGSLRLLFPGAEGTLHFLPVKNRAPNGQDRGEDDSVEYVDDDGSSAAPTIAFSHINPYLMHGLEGIYENKQVVDESGERMYMRIDLPGIGEKMYTVRVSTLKNMDNLIYAAEGRKEYYLDEGGRDYLGVFCIECGCCKIVGVHHEMKDGVLRVLLRKVNVQDCKLLPTNCNKNSRKGT